MTLGGAKPLRKVRHPMNPLNAYLALEIMHDHAVRAERHRRARPRQAGSPAPRYEAVTIRRATPDDRNALERLAQLEGRRLPSGAALVAEVHGRVLAARWLDSGATLSDPFHPTADLGALLAARARHLGARPSFVAHPVRRLAAALRH
jgi:hypothetical protein